MPFGCFSTDKIRSHVAHRSQKPLARECSGWSSCQRVIGHDGLTALIMGGEPSRAEITPAVP